MITLFWIAVGLILYAYVVYPLILLVFRDGIEREFIKEPITPRVSVIIAAYNEEAVIEDKIRNSLALDYPREKLEIIVASDGSDDATNEIVARYKDHGVDLYAFEQREGKINALNKVMMEVTGEIIILSDANTMYEPDVIRRLVRNFADPRVGCVCGELKLAPIEGSEAGEVEGVYWRFEQFMKRIEGSHGSLLGANGGIYALRKELYALLPPNTLIEDFVMPMKILQKGYAVTYEPRAIGFEEMPARVEQERVRRIRIGAGAFQSLGMLWPLLNPLRKFTALSFFSHKVLRWLTPFFMIAAFISNIFILDHGLFSVIFAAQIFFYGLSAAGYIFIAQGVRSGIFCAPYYFVSMNVALLIGFFKFITGTQRVTWERTER